MKFILPGEVLRQHLMILGKTGAGKSSVLRYIVEHLLRQNKRVAIIDPKGDHWGLKWSADGKSEGFPVIAFGDFKEAKATDIPINPQAGKHVAELITSGNRPCIIGFRGWMTSHMVRFWIDFASTIFNQNEGELYLVGDEFHNFAPKGQVKGLEGNMATCLHWSNRLVNEGRGLGITCLLASQRPQKVHNDTLTACDTLVAMRVVHKADRGAVSDWIEGCGDMERGKEVLSSLAGMTRGEAFVWSAEIDFGPKRITFPLFETFDSFAPPQLQKKVHGSGWGNVDLEAVKTKLAAVIEEHKLNDPVLLQRTVAELRQQNRILQMAQPVASPLPEPVPVPVPVLDDATKSLLEKFDMRVEDWSKGSVAILSELRALRETISMATQNAHKLAHRATPQASYAKPRAVIQKVEVPRKTKPEPTPLRQVASVTQAEPVDRALSKPEKAILSVLASFPEGCEVGKIALLSGYKQSGTFMSALSWLRMRGLLIGENSAVMQITEEGLAQGPFEAIPTGQQAIEYWANFRHFGKPEKCIIRALASANGNGMTKEELCEATGYEIPPSGTFMSALSALRTAGLLIGKNSELMQLSDILRS